MTHLTSKQWFQIISGVISGLITGAALLTTLFGQDLTIKIVAVLGIINIVLSSVGTAVSGQANLVRDVAAMPGVDRISVNANATLPLASVAIDPEQKKVGPTTAQVRATLTETARG
jgi:hypothetical protein